MANKGRGEYFVLDASYFSKDALAELGKSDEDLTEASGVSRERIRQARKGQPVTEDARWRLFEALNSWRLAADYPEIEEHQFVLECVRARTVAAARKAISERERLFLPRPRDGSTEAEFEKWLEKFDDEDKDLATQLGELARNRFHFDAEKFSNTIGKELTSLLADVPTEEHAILIPLGAFRKRVEIVTEAIKTFNPELLKQIAIHDSLESVEEATFAGRHLIVVDDLLCSGGTLINQIDDWVSKPEALDRLRQCEKVSFLIAVVFGDALGPCEEALEVFDELGINRYCIRKGVLYHSSNRVNSPDFQKRHGIDGEACVKLCEKYERISFNPDHDEFQPLGTGDGGSLVSFYYTTHSSTIPILWSPHHDWYPLFPVDTQYTQVIPLASDPSGRDDELRELRGAFESGSQNIVVSGESGIGKTHLLAYVARHHRDFGLQGVVWQTLHPFLPLESLLRNLTQFVQRFPDPGDGLPADDTGDLCESLASTIGRIPKDYLLVIDRVELLYDDANGLRFLEALAAIDPSEGPRVCIAGTPTQEAPFERLCDGCLLIELGELGDDAAKEILLTGYGSKSNYASPGLESFAELPSITLILPSTLTLLNKMYSHVSGLPDAVREFGEMSSEEILTRLIELLWDKLGNGERRLLSIAASCYPPRREAILRAAYERVLHSSGAGIDDFDTSLDHWKDLGFPIFSPLRVSLTNYLPICASLATAVLELLKSRRLLNGESYHRNASRALGEAVAAKVESLQTGPPQRLHGTSILELAEISIYHLIEAGDGLAAIRALRRFMLAYEAEGRVDELLDLIDVVLERRGDAEAREEGRILKMNVLRRASRQDEALKLIGEIEEDLKASGATPTPIFKAKLLFYRAVALASKGQYEDALGVLSEAVILGSEQLDPSERIAVLPRIHCRAAQVQMGLGRMREALVSLEAAIALLNESEDEIGSRTRTDHGWAVVLRHLGTLFFLLGVEPESRRYFKLALRLNEIIDDREGQAICRYKLGRNAWLTAPLSFKAITDAIGETEFARSILDDNLTSNAWWRSAALEQVASFLIDLAALGYSQNPDQRDRHLARARELLERSSKLMEGMTSDGERPFPLREAELRMVQAKLLAAAGEKEASIDKFYDELREADRLGALFFGATSRYEFARILANLGELHQAVHHLQTAIRDLSKAGMSGTIYLCACRLLYVCLKARKGKPNIEIAANRLMAYHLRAFYAHRVDAAANRRPPIPRGDGAALRKELRCLFNRPGGSEVALRTAAKALDIYAECFLELEAFDFIRCLEECLAWPKVDAGGARGDFERLFQRSRLRFERVVGDYAEGEDPPPGRLGSLLGRLDDLEPMISEKFGHLDDRPNGESSAGGAQRRH